MRNRKSGGHRNNRSNHGHSHSHNHKHDNEPEAAPADERLERLKVKLQKRPIPCHIIAGSEDNDLSDKYALSIVQLLIRRRNRMRGTGRKHRSTFILLSASPLADTIVKTKPDDLDLIHFKLKNDKSAIAGDDVPSAAVRSDVLKVLRKIEKLQLKADIGRRVHGLFIHTNSCGLPHALALRACVASMFQDHVDAVRRLDFHGVVGVCMCSNLLQADRAFCALVDQMVAVEHDHDLQVSESLRDAMKVRNCRANLLVAERNEDDTLHMSEAHLELVDEIFAYSRYVVTQIFPDNDDRRPAIPTPESVVLSEDKWEQIIIKLPNHKSIDLQRFQFWLESLLKEHGEDILRLKGLFAVQGARAKCVLQGVGSCYGMEFSGEFWNQSRRGTLMLVARKLNVAKLRTELQHCIAVMGPFESLFWWIDAHCCVCALFLTLCGTLGVMLTMLAMDNDFIGEMTLETVFGFKPSTLQPETPSNEFQDAFDEIY